MMIRSLVDEADVDEMKLKGVCRKDNPGESEGGYCMCWIRLLVN